MVSTDKVSWELQVTTPPYTYNVRIVLQIKTRRYAHLLYYVMAIDLFPWVTNKTTYISDAIYVTVQPTRQA